MQIDFKLFLIFCIVRKGAGTPCAPINDLQVSGFTDEFQNDLNLPLSFRIDITKVMLKCVNSILKYKFAYLLRVQIEVNYLARIILVEQGIKD